MYFLEIIKLAHKIQTFVKSTKIIIATVPEIFIISNIPLTIEKKSLKVYIIILLYKNKKKIL